jgi:type I restriction enzyme S subunit
MTEFINKGWYEPTPVEWNVQRMKNVMSPKEERSLTGEEELLSVTINEGIIKRSQYLDDDEGGSRADSLVGYKVVEPTNLVNNIMKMSFRCLGVSSYSGIVSPAYSVFELDHSKVDPSYLNYLLRTDIYVAEFRKLSKGIQESRMRLYDDYFLAMKVIVPSTDEQKTISRYLDKKTLAVDSLITKIQYKIQLVKEQRNTLINQCVSVGRYVNIEMEESRVEWVTKIPKHWNTYPIKRIFLEYFGGSWGDDQTEGQTENLVRVIRVTEFDMDFLTVAKEIPTIRSLSLSTDSKKLIRKNDLILEKSGGGEKTPVGRIVLVDREIDFPTINSNFTNVCRPNTEIVDPKFALFSLFASYTNGQTLRNIKQTTGIQNLDLDGFMSELIPLPPLKEQREIASFLEAENNLFLKRFKQLSNYIDLLKEYRQSIISSVVTGKLRVTEEMI